MMGESVLEAFVIFLGNPRSGTTLVRSLLDAHQQVIISNEEHLLPLIDRGLSWEEALERIEVNAQRFRDNPRWTNYSYQIATDDSLTAQPIKVVGDKKAGSSTRYLMQNPTSIHHLQEWCPIPIKVLHCVRNPLDVIATEYLRNGLTLSIELNIYRYFVVEKEAVRLGKMLGNNQYHQLHQESLIAQPVEEMKKLLNFLDLEGSTAYFNACQQAIYEKPNQSRSQIDWTPELQQKVNRFAQSIPHLSAYLKQE
ncbi:MAG: sulfotransferase family protein [Flammeovirgaceae bacterium]